MIALTEYRKSDRIIRVKDGWAACPICGNGRLKLVRPDETAELVYIHCRRCKNDIRLCLNRASALRARASMIRFDAVTLALALFSPAEDL